jgi:hypothetical protein
MKKSRNEIKKIISFMMVLKTYLGINLTREVKATTNY